MGRTEDEEFVRLMLEKAEKKDSEPKPYSGIEPSKKDPETKPYLKEVKEEDIKAAERFTRKYKDRIK